ncbi:MAG: MlaD family protein [Campylobacterota bacterium]|nr:MlaD family protein [Campylobacterota bacterium]
MDSKVNYTLVGAFLFIFILSIIGFSFWLGKYGMDSKKVDLYRVYLEESISGLNIESSIKYKGLNIGMVKDIKINSNNSEQIEILLEVDYGTPIKKDTIAILETQGITGLKYIDLVGGSHKSELLKNKKDEIPTIESRQSFLGNLGSSAVDMTKKVDILLNKLNLLINRDNIDKVSNILNNSDVAIKTLNSSILTIEKQVNTLLSDKNIEKLNESLINFDKFTKQLNITLEKTDKVIDNDLKETLIKVSDASDSTNLAFIQFTKLISDGKLDLEEITSDSLKKFDILILEMERTMQNGQKTIDNLNDSPSDILFKSRDIDFGPGEDNE